MWFSCVGKSLKFYFYIWIIKIFESTNNTFWKPYIQYLFRCVFTLGSSHGHTMLYLPMVYTLLLLGFIEYLTRALTHHHVMSNLQHMNIKIYILINILGDRFM